MFIAVTVNTQTGKTDNMGWAEHTGLACTGKYKLGNISFRIIKPMVTQS